MTPLEFADSLVEEQEHEAADHAIAAAATTVEIAEAVDAGDLLRLESGNEPTRKLTGVCARLFRRR